MDRERPRVPLFARAGGALAAGALAIVLGTALPEVMRMVGILPAGSDAGARGLEGGLAVLGGRGSDPGSAARAIAPGDLAENPRDDRPAEQGPAWTRALPLRRGFTREAVVVRRGAAESTEAIGRIGAGQLVLVVSTRGEWALVAHVAEDEGGTTTGWTLRSGIVEPTR